MRLSGSETYVQSIARTQQARRMGLDKATLTAMSLPEQMAAQWLVQNDKALEEMRGERRYHLLNYDTFCNDPLQQAAALFRNLDLGWPAQTQAFIEKSSQAFGQSGYYGLFRRSKDESAKWRKELSAGQIEQIKAIARRGEAGRLFFTDTKDNGQEATLCHQ